MTSLVTIVLVIFFLNICNKIGSLIFQFIWNCNSYITKNTLKANKQFVTFTWLFIRLKISSLKYFKKRNWCLVYLYKKTISPLKIWYEQHVMDERILNHLNIQHLMQVNLDYWNWFKLVYYTYEYITSKY